MGVEFYFPLLDERNAAEDRLRAAGVEILGAGMGFGGWDICIIKPNDEALELTSNEEVDRYIESIK